MAADYRQRLEALYDALSREVYEVTVGDQTVRYSTKAELLKAIRKFEALAAMHEASGSGDGHRAVAYSVGRFR